MTTPMLRAMPHDTTRVLVTDLDGVVRTWPREFSADIERRWALPEGSLFQAAFGDKVLLGEAITGRITDEAWRQTIADRLSSEHMRDLREAVGEWARSPGMVDPAALSAIRRIGEVTDVVLHTNATTRLPADLAALGLHDCFAAVINSATVGVAKPERAAFEAVLEITGQPPEQLVFVDDSTPTCPRRWPWASRRTSSIGRGTGPSCLPSSSDVHLNRLSAAHVCPCI